MKAKKKFVFSEPEKTHVIKLKKRKYWWLLLFLLLLILFVKINYYVEYQVVGKNTKAGIEKIDVKVSFAEQEKNVVIVDQTNKNGIVKFKIGGKRLFQFLMFWNETKDFEIEAITSNGCYKTNTLIDLYGILKEQINILYVDNNSPLQIKVKNLTTKNIIKNANIEVEIGKKVVTSGSTDANGILNSTVPLCNNLFIKAKKNNYSDTTYNYVFENTKNDSLNELIIYLRPLAKDYTFYIHKCYNAGRDHYELFVDGEYISYHKITSGGDLPNSGDGAQLQHDSIVVPMSIGKHTIEMKLKKEYELGTCGSCSRIEIQEVNFSKNFYRAFGSNITSFSWEVDINK